MKLSARKNMFPTPTLEITTLIGCKINCKYCPQKLLINRYRKFSNVTRMSFETFVSCIDKLPSEVDIHFSGMSEPWLNSDCTEMLLYADKQGHRITVYSTLVGMTCSDFKRIQDINFQKFVVHLPDETDNANIPISKDYLTLIERVFKHFNNKQDQFDISCHGPIHSEIKNIIQLNNFEFSCLENAKKMIDRAGNLFSNPDVEHRYYEHALECCLSSSHFNRNVLLPNGMVLLCCMDYGMEVVLGNLLEGDYFDLFRSRPYFDLQNSLKNGGENICRRCHNAIPWQRPYRQIEIKSILDNEAENTLPKFCAYLAEKCDLDAITYFLPEKPVSFSIPEIENTIPFLPDISYLLDETSQPSWSAISEMMDYILYAVLYLPTPFLRTFGQNELLATLERFLTQKGLIIDQIGWSIQSFDNAGMVIILANNANVYEKISPPLNFRVVAIISTFNEEDVIIPCIEHLKQNGVDVYIIDNWSTDKTYELVEQMLGQGVIGIERWPESGPSNSYDWKELLKRKEELALDIDADWFIHHDADEIRESPWQGVSLREAFWEVDRLGFNAVDFTLVNFSPIDNDFVPGTSFVDYFDYFEFSKRPGHFIQIKAWKKTSDRVNLHSSGGHDVKFKNRKVFPYNFLLRHYPFRSQEQGEKKVFKERKPRYALRRKEEGWHTQYDGLQQNSNFIKSPKDLIAFNDNFYSNFLIERLSGIGLSPLEKKPSVIIDELRTKIKQLELENEEINQSLQDATQGFPGSQYKVQLLEEELFEREQEVLFYALSKSWKITKPLRDIKRMLKKKKD